MTPQFVDLNADGYDDILTATFTGRAFVLYGSPAGYEKPKKVLNEASDSVRLTEYWSDKTNQHESQETDESMVRGRMTSIAAVDWDNDGDFDLVLGGYSTGMFGLCENIGNPSQPKFSTKVEPVENVSIETTLTNHLAHDWDGDGRFDLICGTSDQGVKLFRNIGAAGKPKFSDPVNLISGSGLKPNETVPVENGEPNLGW